VVLSGALGRHRVIDIAAAVTVGGDRVTPIAATSTPTTCT
jgi:hypothetical protein